MNFEIAPKETETILSWDDAHLYCFSLNIDGKTGWRLPTMNELREIYKSDNDFEDTWYWSSTEHDMHNAWNQNFYNGFRDTNRKISGGLLVRAIRSI